MALTDRWGEPTGTDNRAALEAYERAILGVVALSGDPLAEIRGAVAADPGFAFGHLIEAVLHLYPMTRAQALAAQGCLARAEAALRPQMPARLRGHLHAARAWASGHWQDAAAAWEAVLLEHPRDLFATKVLQDLYFFLGDSANLRDTVGRVLPSWSESDAGYGFLLGMLAFGLEESGDYQQAERLGRAAIARNAYDPWAHHAVAHVLEMQGRIGDGIAFLSGGAPYWAESFFAVHNWWHLALYELDHGDGDAALELYDGPLRGGVSDQPLDLVDASALLWRLKLAGFEPGRHRWQALAKLWQAYAEDLVYCFNDVHAMMAFVGAGEEEQAEALRARLAARSLGQDSNAMMTREVGLPLAEAFIEFGRDHDGEAVDLLLATRRRAPLFGGSHAQRDLIEQTLLAAALRGGQHPLARALAGERLARKETSPGNWRWMARAWRGLGQTAQADAADQRARALAQLN
ncbi:MAG TPA: tetratricopeptide repeat protein [Hypericibacter adhaerens]|uniref:tetratricopeptide repeat protein n=1 Tax=Hypericibacter adhaerens TaxID=2602016 RepID=UPI002BB16431|nr:tetratricopeptide repeat protein [Hypericibacter adhaerens]HWA43642.1 tetratricopeptide repeat protein [Hypericibacter adhaerens]